MDEVLSPIRTRTGLSEHVALPNIKDWMEWSKGFSKAIQELESIRQTPTFPKGAVLFHQGTECHGLYLLHSGSARLTTVGSTGCSLTMRIAEAGEVLGLRAALTCAAYGISAETMEPTRPLSYPGKSSCAL